MRRLLSVVLGVTGLGLALCSLPFSFLGEHLCALADRIDPDSSDWLKRILRL